MNIDFNIKIYIVLAVLFASISSFFLGGILVYTLLVDDEISVTTNSLDDIDFKQNDRVYASKNGTKYYPWWCTAGTRIKEENKVFFDTPKKAKEAGYTLASRC